jgi:hypothetical protein
MHGAETIQSLGGISRTLSVARPHSTAVQLRCHARAVGCSAGIDRRAPKPPAAFDRGQPEHQTPLGRKLSVRHTPPHVCVGASCDELWRARCLPSVSTRVCPCGGPVHQSGHSIHGAWLGCVDRANFRIRPRRTQPQCGRVWTLGWVTRAGLDRAWAYPRGPWSNASVRRDSVHAGLCCVGRRARPPHTIYPPCTASATFERSQLAGPPGLARGVPNARRWPPAFCSRRLLSGAG